MEAFSYIDGAGVERVMRANSREEAYYTVKRIEEERTGSIAAGDVAAATMRPYEPQPEPDEVEGHRLEHPKPPTYEREHFHARNPVSR